jgi:release factor glutamine methyltransferase
MKFSDAVKKLSDAGIKDAKREARVIFTSVGGYSFADLVGTDLKTGNESVIDAVERRAKREPLQYVIGSVDFYYERYKVTPDCLIPRQDTEILVNLAVKMIPEGESFLDLCTGSGCIAISTLKNTKDTRAVAVDLSEGALDIAKENAEQNGVLDRLTLLRADVLKERIDGEFFAILSNPPYVTSAAYSALEPELYFEPEMALVGTDDDGAGFYRRIIETYSDSIKDGGFFAFEIGFDQAQPLCDAASAAGMRCEIIKDLCGLDRVALIRK